MFSKLLSKFKFENIEITIKRFPISFIIIIILFSLLIINYNSYFSDSSKIIILNLIYTLILTFFLSFGIHLSIENQKISNTKKILSFLVLIVFGVLFYLFFNGEFVSYSDFILFITSLFGIIAFVFFAPFIKDIINNKIDNNIIYQYISNISTVFLFAFVLGGILFLLGSFAIMAINSLFDMSWQWTDDFYFNWAIFSLSFITPIVFLLEVPIENTKNDKKFFINKFSSFLIKYVFTSFLIIYFLILYAYSLKVLLNFNNWPKGEICGLVIAFSIFGYITYTLAYYFDKIKGIKILRKIFPYVVIPQLFMLFYSIILRINQYDLTINRYLVLAFGIWLIIISFYYIFSKKKFLITIPVLTTIFAILISIGPWSIYNLPKARQIKRLENNMIKAGILKSGEVFPLENYTDIDAKLSKEIYEGISYLCNETDCKYVKNKFASITETSLDTWNTIQNITDKLKVRQYPENYYSLEKANIYVSVGEEGFFPIQIDSYDYFTEINNGIGMDYKKLYIAIDTENNLINIINNSKVDENIDLGNIREQIYEKVINESTNNQETKRKWGLASEDLIFNYEGIKYEIKLMISSANFKNPQYDGKKTIIYEYINGYALIKIK